MNLDREIHALTAELYGRARIPCALMGRKVRETECSSRCVGATALEFQTCRACLQGHRVAATSPFTPRNLLPLAGVLAIAIHAGEAASKRASRSEPKTPRIKRLAAQVFIGVDHGAAGGDKTVEVKLTIQPDGHAVLNAREVAPLLQKCHCVDPGLAKLARALRELTQDGRLRVSMLDLMHSLGASNYDEAGALVSYAGLRTSRLFGPVQAVLVDHNVRRLLESTPESEVRQ